MVRVKQITGSVSEQMSAPHCKKLGPLLWLVLNELSVPDQSSAFIEAKLDEYDEVMLELGISRPDGVELCWALLALYLDTKPEGQVQALRRELEGRSQAGERVVLEDAYAVLQALELSETYRVLRRVIYEWAESSLRFDGPGDWDQVEAILHEFSDEEVEGVLERALLTTCARMEAEHGEQDATRLLEFLDQMEGDDGGEAQIPTFLQHLLGDQSGGDYRNN
jgi:hypothetical protein